LSWWDRTRCSALANTTAGAGADMAAAGKAIEKSADKNKG
jgi:predicted small secreted protein